MSETETISKTGVQPQDFLHYFTRIATATASPLLLEALALMAKDPQALVPGFAVDLGCGTGKDTAELLKNNWRVLASDFSQDGIDILLARSEANAFAANLEARVASFTDTKWSDADLVVALLSLPYSPPAEFPLVWSALTASLKSGGYLVCQLFGTAQYADADYITHHTRADIDALLTDYTVLKLKEVDRPVTHGETTFRYHYFDIIARRR